MADARVLADLVTNSILSMQGEAHPGTLSPELEGLAAYRAELHQAAGIVARRIRLDE